MLHTIASYLMNFAKLSILRPAQSRMPVIDDFLHAYSLYHSTKLLKKACFEGDILLSHQLLKLKVET